MIPIQLTIEGLYSYQERQTIDFRNLTEAGLFGIFGSVGSGKSSILEAISFALYGETERLNMRDKRAYNMMNLKSNSSYIAFDFINHENKIFRATRDFKRNSKKFDDVKPSSVTFYEYIHEQWIPLGHSRCEDIIGLSYANFKRTIIIPQGQFKEFLELGATERTNMMKEIFSLQRFDLQNNVSVLYSKNRSELDQLEGQLKGFEEVNEEQIYIQKERLQLEQQKYDEVKSEFTKTEERYQLLKNLKSDFNILKEKKENFERFSLQKAEIDSLEVKTELYDTTFRIFNPLITEKNRLQNEISSQHRNRESQTVHLKETEVQFESVKNKIAALLPKFEALHQSKIQENDLSLILQMLKSSEEMKILNERTQKGSLKVKEVTEKQTMIQQTINELLKNSDELKRKKLDSTILLNVGNWFLERKKLNESHQKQREKTNEKKAEAEKISAQLDSLNIKTESFQSDFKLINDVLEIQKKELSQKRSHLEVQQKLAHFASELHDGESCPLCGALEHPDIVVFEDVNSEISEIQKKLESIELQQKEIQNQILETEKLSDRKKIFEEQLKAENETLTLIQIQIENHSQNFIWKEFNAENEAEFERKRQQSFAMEKEIEELSQTVAKEQKNLEKERENLEKFSKALEDFRLKEKEVATAVSTNEANLKILKWTHYQIKTLTEVEDAYQKLKKENLDTDRNYQELTAKEKELAPKLAEQKTNVSHTEKRISELEKEFSGNENLLTKALSAHQFTGLQDVQTILLQEINIQECRNRIQNFRIEFEKLKSSIEDLSLKLKDFSFDEEQFTTVEKQYSALETDLKSANDSMVKIKTEIERLEKEFKKKGNLLNDLAKLQKRAGNLKIMTNLFKGAGFVQYVSSIYLHQLCDHANIRFHRMTRNQLSLQLNENHDFEIVDYLNEGRSRSVKTLSGGQAFQVSLSLALALAESVQANAKADKNFFFIDEGFGTQDLESVNVVFETLMSLRKENRIVGIISHVEELKEKIPVSLNITKHEERGSLIEII